MKTTLSISSVALLAILCYLAYALDQWLGIVAYTFPYLIFCTVSGLAISIIWLPISKTYSVPIGLIPFAILASNFLLGPPSERLLRSALLKLPSGTHAQLIESIVKKEYENSDYTLPFIKKDESRVHVSLSSQQAGNATALIFRIKDGIIINRKYSRD